MNKTELIDAIATKADLPKTTTGRVLDAFLNVISESLANGEQVSVKGFGNFAISERAARTGRNPQTGAEIAIPASKLPKFTASAQLKSAVNP